MAAKMDDYSVASMAGPWAAKRAGDWADSTAVLRVVPTGAS